MARSRSACGTEAAYRRHLREAESVDDACRQAHSEAVSRWRNEEPARAEAAELAPSATAARDSAKAAVRANVAATFIAITENDLYTVIDRSVELDALVDAWCDAEDDLAPSVASQNTT